MPGDDPNDLPLHEMQSDLNASLITLMQEKALQCSARVNCTGGAPHSTAAQDRQACRNTRMIRIIILAGGVIILGCQIILRMIVLG